MTLNLGLCGGLSAPLRSASAWQPLQGRGPQTSSKGRHSTSARSAPPLDRPAHPRHNTRRLFTGGWPALLNESSGADLDKSDGHRTADEVSTPNAADSGVGAARRGMRQPRWSAAFISAAWSAPIEEERSIWAATSGAGATLGATHWPSYEGYPKADPRDRRPGARRCGRALHRNLRMVGAALPRDAGRAPTRHALAQRLDKGTRRGYEKEWTERNPANTPYWEPANHVVRRVRPLSE